jgi:CRISPR-associated protein Cmr1
MKSITFTCETITPMFLSGADGQTPELRAPSIKGALRFWWRAMNGHLPTKEGDQWDYLPLKEAEQKIFGGSGMGENNNKIDAQKSAFGIRISDFPENNYRASNEYKDKPGLRYLFYLIVPDKNGRVMSENDFAIKNNTVFDIILSSDDESILLKACASFWLLTYFGGLGSRARRGGGNFTITDIEDEHEILTNKLSMKPENNSIDFLKAGFKNVVNIIRGNANLNNICVAYSTLVYDRIFVSKNSKETWKDALNEIGDIMRDYRTDTERDVSKRTQTQQTLDQKAAFGLPVSVRGGGTVEFNNKKDYNHHSSPIIISVVKLGTKYHWTLIHLQGDFMAPDTKIIFNNLSWNNVDNKLLNEFLEDVMKQSTILTF